MKQAVFNYPNFGTPDGYPDYTAHRGQTVNVVEQLPPEIDDLEPLFLIQAQDGWTGNAWESELCFIEVQPEDDTVPCAESEISP